MSKIPSFEEAAKFHGHICPGLAIGYQVSALALDKLKSSKSEDEEFLAIVENDSCSVDGIQFITGCTFGKGNLIFKDYGKQVFTFVNRNTGANLRIYFKADMNDLNPEFSKLKDLLLKNPSKENKDKFEKVKLDLSQKILNMPFDDLFDYNEVDLDVPNKAMIFDSLHCSNCGELVSKHRTKNLNRNEVCIPCFNKLKDDG